MAPKRGHGNPKKSSPRRDTTQHWPYNNGARSATGLRRNRFVPLSNEITCLLHEACRGDGNAVNQLLPLVYDELRALAQRHMQGERPDHTLQATALVHEAYMRLIGQHDVDWRSRAQFFALAAQAMRRILVDHARRHTADKRGGGMQRVDLDGADGGDLSQRSAYVIAVDEALSRFAAIDAQAGRVVELRFFGGLTVEETAEVLDVSPRTVKRDWRAAKAWLARELAAN
jgi:RNA polymerase sigma factor (TIGR02999 family)